jgi:hypothetical protein
VNVAMNLMLGEADGDGGRHALRKASPTMARFQGWLPLASVPAAVVAVMPAGAPRWVTMWALALAIYGGCKWLTWRRTPAETAVARQLGYLLAWPGMDATAFLGSDQTVRPTIQEWSLAALKLAFGLVVLYGVAPGLVAISPLLAGVAGMISLVLAIHFGAFHLLSCAWRVVGVDAKPLMDWPIVATSLSEFWGRRWNRAFRDLTHRFLFRPLTPRLGAMGALIVGFFVSGLVHDAVISWPAQGGYGLPTLFFLIQGAGIAAERSRVGRRFGLGKGWRGWAFAACLLIGPAPLLFHRPFVERVIVPLVAAVGAL